ncbi:hypothetical protein [Geodermatophilus sp. TF02-6]|uniref:hypothetical protein n=1 Tax=Geodermatophilus sp. TF02-6 TaxID=2250575 RepID=UPI0011BF85B4|nr:hypothetical protein [Geodermatophilus sp. TF02-6]
MSYQSIRAVPARRLPGDAAHRDRDLRRLLAVWRALGARYIAAQAHGGADELELADALAGIEHALEVRHPAAWQALQGDLHVALVEAEHSGDAVTPSSDCVVCRRISDGLPISIGQPVRLTEEAR